MSYKYYTFSLSITVISWMVGMIVNSFLRKTHFYRDHLSNFNFIRNEQLNLLIGLPVCKWVVKNTFFGFFNQKITIKKRIDRAGLIKLREEMTIAEIDHLIGFAFVAAFAVFNFYHGRLALGLTIMALNTLLNLYPSLLQQANKRRIDKLIN